MQSNNSVNVITILSAMDGGKTTLGKYFMEQLNKPTLIIDIAKQFEENTRYRKIIKGLNELKYYLSNKHYRNAFYKSRLQLIYRFTSKDKQLEANNLFEWINDHLKHITIFCEEMELYADSYLRKSSPIFETFYLCRNSDFDVIVIAKIAGQLSSLVKAQTTIFYANTRATSAIKYLDERSGNEFSKQVKHLKNKEFLVIENDSITRKFKLNKNIIKLIK